MSVQRTIAEFTESCDHLEAYRIAGRCLRCDDPTPDGPADGFDDAREGRSAAGGQK